MMGPTIFMHCANLLQPNPRHHLLQHLQVCPLMPDDGLCIGAWRCCRLSSANAFGAHCSHLSSSPLRNGLTRCWPVAQHSFVFVHAIVAVQHPTIVIPSPAASATSPPASPGTSPNPSSSMHPLQCQMAHWALTQTTIHFACGFPISLSPAFASTPMMIPGSRCLFVGSPR